MAAAFLDDARQRGLRPAARAFAAQIAAILLLVIAAVLLTRGNLYRQLYLHTATSVGKAWTWQQLWSLLWVSENPCPLRMYPAYFAITALAAVWSAFHRPSRALLIYFLTACVIFLTGGRIGSAHNYLIEPTAIGAMMFGVMWAVLSRRPGLPRVFADWRIPCGQRTGTGMPMSENTSGFRSFRRRSGLNKADGLS